MCSQFEVQDNIIPILLNAKLQKLLNPDGFKLQKEFMIELEEISNKKMPADDLIDYSPVLADVKCLIFREMVSSKKHSEIAKNYIKKCLLARSGDTKFVD